MTHASTPAPLAVLEHAAVGAPITRAGVTLFPVYLFQPLPVTVVTGTPGAVEVAEADTESVLTLTVTSQIDDPFLLVEGETVAGGLQHRTLNVSVLVPPRARIDVPVSCVEAGRWGGDRQFRGSGGHTSRRVRRAKSAGVAENLRRSGTKHSDQGAVWETVNFELDRLGVSSSTRNFADSEIVFTQQRRLAAAATRLIERGPLPGQCGVVIGHGSRVVSAEVFATHDLLAAQWDQLVRAALLDAPDAISGRPSASRALRFLRRLAKAEGTESEGVGLGRERHVRTDRLVGQILTWDATVVHAAAFALAA